MIHVAVSIDFTKESDVYQMYLSTLTMSIVDTTSYPVTLHIFYIGKFPEDFASHLQSRFSGYDIRILPHCVNIEMEFLSLPNIGMWSPVIINKFYFPDILKDINKVIFFDLDIVLKKDISFIWNTDMNGYCIAGVQYKNTDSINREYNSYEKEHSLEKRVNGGMIIMDLNRIRDKYDLVDEAKRFVKEYPDIQGVDEIFFNEVFFDETMLLPSYYQHFLGMDDRLYDEEDIEYQNKIICMHYAFKSKPNKYVNGTPDYYFWKYLKMVYDDEVVNKLIKEYFSRVGKMKMELRNKGTYVRTFYEKIMSNNIYLFGTGIFSRKLCFYLEKKGIKISGFFDNDSKKYARKLYGHIIQSPDYIDNMEDGNVILIAILNDFNNMSVQKQLMSKGLVDGKSFFDSRMIFEDIREVETEETR